MSTAWSRLLDEGRSVIAMNSGCGCQRNGWTAAVFRAHAFGRNLSLRAVLCDINAVSKCLYMCVVSVADVDWSRHATPSFLLQTMAVKKTNLCGVATVFFLMNCGVLWIIDSAYRFVVLVLLCHRLSPFAKCALRPFRGGIGELISAIWCSANTKATQPRILAETAEKGLIHYQTTRTT